MRTVEDRHFAFFVRFDVINQTNVQRQFVQTQLLSQTFRPLDHEQIEVFRAVEKAVLIAQFLLQTVHFAAWITGHDAVNQR